MPSGAVIAPRGWFAPLSEAQKPPRRALDQFTGHVLAPIAPPVPPPPYGWFRPLDLPTRQPDRLATLSYRFELILNFTNPSFIVARTRLDATKTAAALNAQKVAPALDATQLNASLNGELDS